MTTSSKYDKAVEKATGLKPEHAPDAVIDRPVMTKGAQAMIAPASQQDIADLMSDPTLEFAPQALSLEEGQMISGVLEGEGPMAEVTDPTTKEVRDVPTWVIRSHDGNARVSILTSAQLEKKLPPFIGHPVKIIRGKDLKTGTGRRVTDYLVCGPKLANGKQRSFASPLSSRALPESTGDAQVDATGQPSNHKTPNAEQHA